MREDKKTESNNIAIKVEGLKKTFRVPHEKNTSIKGAALSVFKKKTYEEFRALNDVSFEIKRGEFFGIIGRNGSGKSTLLKMLAGIYVPDSGRITINGKVSPFLELGVGFNAELSGRENLYLGGAVLGLSRKDIEEKYQSIVSFAELDDFMDMKLKNYSSGMQVRLAFSLAINAHAEILLMDEVLAVGDNNFQAKCLEEFTKYRREGKTVVLVSHDLNTIQKYCDRAMLLKKGRVVLIDTAERAGDEYVRENIKDEEVLLKKQNNKKSKSDLTKTAEILSVKLLDKDENIVNSAICGKPLIIEVKYRAKHNLTTVNIGLGLHSASDDNLFGYNTQMDKIILKKGENTLRLRFKDFPVLRGTYFLNAVIFGEVEAVPFDFKPRIVTFNVRTLGQEKMYRGCVKIEHSWENEGETSVK